MCHEQTIPTLKELQSEWSALPNSEQDEIFHEFSMDCADSGREPSDYWYRLLMPRLLSH